MASKRIEEQVSQNAVAIQTLIDNARQLHELPSIISFEDDDRFLVQIDSTKESVAVTWQELVSFLGIVSGGTELLDEGNGNGLVTVGRDPSNFGNVGLNAVDLSVGSGISSVRGATGLRAVALGFRAEASGEDSFAWGYDAKASGDYSFATVNSVASGLTSISMGASCTASASRAIAMGFQAQATNSQAISMGENTLATGQGSVAMGRHTIARSSGEFSAGRFGTDTAGRVFNFGNGEGTGDRYDIMTGKTTGLVTVPQQTTALIDTDGKAIITKEYADANYSGGGGTPGGIDTAIQFNNKGSFDGDSELTFNTLSKTLTTRTFQGTFNLLTDGYVGIIERPLKPSNIAGQGHIWVKDDSPNTLWFTNDADEDFQLEENTINSVTVGEPTGSDVVLNVVSLTQAEYDAGTPVATTIYNITDA